MSSSPKVQDYPVDRVTKLLPKPSRDTNKYQRGKLNIVGGCKHYPGSVCLTSKAASRMGAGYVEVMCDAQSAPLVRGYAPSVVATDWTEAPDRIASTNAEKPTHPLAWVVGSGMTGQGSIEQALVMEVMKSPCPVLGDGGGLTILATAQGRALAQARAQSSCALVLTPHFGEASRLAKGARIAIPATQDEPALASFALELSDAYGAVIALKGPVTYVASSERDLVYRMDRGTAALAKAGTGDVLAGMIGALLAQGLDPVDAAYIGALLHAESGREAEAELGEISVMAEDVVTSIPRAIMQLP